MKLLLVLLPLAFAAPAPEKRMLLGDLGNIFHVDELRKLTTQLFNTLGSNETEAQCETECNLLIHQDHILHFGCPLVCREFQSLVQRFGLAPAATSKRSVLDSLTNVFVGDELKLLTTQLYNALGSNETEQACETECKNLIHADHILSYACPLVCHSFQELVHRFHLHIPAVPGKRSVLDSLSHFLHVDQLKLLTQQLVTTLGSDATEQACETECGTLVQQDHIFQFACPLVCHSFQELVHKFNVQAPANPSGGAAKRDLVTSLAHLFNGDELKHVVSQLFNTLGSDATEAACETQCNTILRQDNVLHHGCPLICRGFQTLVQHFGLNAPVDPAVVGKRNLLDSFSHIFNGDELKNVVTQLFNTLGSDDTELKCESQCNTILRQDGILHHGCPLICHSFQNLVQHFGLTTPVDPAVVGKRNILDTLGNVIHVGQLQSLVEGLHELLGSDASEKVCEEECHVLIHTDHVLQYACPLVCHSFQELLHHFNSAVQNNVPAPAHPQRRFLFSLQDLFGNPSIKPLVEQLYQQLGSDETEQNCEAHCIPIAQGLPDHGSVTQYLCPLVCNSFKQLLHKFDIHTLTGPAATGGAVSGSPSSSV